MFRSAVITLALCFAAATAQAALLSRAGGQAYYDDVLNITWLADANYAQTSGYDADGRMDWFTAQGWVASLNTANHLGTNNWRLPTVTDTGAPGCEYSYGGTDCGYHVNPPGEMAHLFSITLANSEGRDTNGNVNPCFTGVPPNCLTNTSPFSNMQPTSYWTGTEYAVDTTWAWISNFGNGAQAPGTKVNTLYAWAVRPGDIGVVPLPAAVWLFGSALTGLGLFRRRQATSTVVSS